MPSTDTIKQSDASFWPFGKLQSAYLNGFAVLVRCDWLMSEGFKVHMLSGQ